MWWFSDRVPLQGYKFARRRSTFFGIMLWTGLSADFTDSRNFSFIIHPAVMTGALTRQPAFRYSATGQTNRRIKSNLSGGALNGHF
jgi:hypothetical protein